MDAQTALMIAQSIVDAINILADPVRLALMDTPMWHMLLWALNYFADLAGVVDIIFEDGSIVLEF